MVRGKKKPFFVVFYIVGPDMIESACLKWRSLEDRRRDARLVMMHKIPHDKVAVSESDRLSPPLRHSRNMYSRSYQVPVEPFLFC
jgi:hypothetical protein